MRLRTTVLLGGTRATGLVVPDEVVAPLASGKRPAEHRRLRDGRGQR